MGDDSKVISAYIRQMAADTKAILAEKLHAISTLSVIEAEAITGAFHTWQLPKDTPVLRQQQVSDYLYFVAKGAIRIYYHKHDKEVTEWIALDEEFFLSIISFFERSPSRLLINTIEPTTLMGIAHSDLMSLCEKYHGIETLFRKMLTGSLILSQHRMDAIQFESAQQRYENLIRKSPQIIQRVPLTYIASFLGISLETLSRIRSNH